MSSDSPDVPGKDSETNDHNGSDDLDALMEILSDQRRRRVLYYLGEQGVVTVDELTDYILDSEANVDETDRRHVLTELQHKHLPKMEAVGVVERENDDVRRRDPNVPVEPYLDLAGRIERR